MEIGGGVEPEAELHLSVALALAEDIGVKSVRLTGFIPQEFEVYLVMVVSFGGQLIIKKKKKYIYIYIYIYTHESIIREKRILYIAIKILGM